MTSRLTFVLVIALLTVPPTHGQAPVSSSTPAATKGVITGRVVTDALDPQPVPKVVVTLHGAPVAGDRAAITTNDGRFTFIDLPRGYYSIAAGKPGYLDVEYGANGPNGTGARIAVDGAPLDLTIRLPFGAVVEGLISTTAAEPFPGVHVEVQRIRADGEPERVGQGADADDRGIYRIFGLPPGEYVISASLPMLSSLAERSIDHPTASQLDAMLMQLRREGATSRQSTGSLHGQIAPAPTTVKFATVYYSGVATADDATHLTLGIGEQRPGLDFVFEPVTTVSVNGTIMGPAATLDRAQVSIQSVGQRSGPASRQGSVHPKSDGTFLISNLPPGRYRVTARAPAAPPTPSPSKAADRDFLYATADVDARGIDVTGLSLVLQPGATVTGRVSTVGTSSGVAAPDISAIRVSLTPLNVGGTRVPGSSLNTVREAAVGADGRFVLDGMAPGHYRLAVGLPPRLSASGWWAQSATVADKDLLDTDVDLTPATSVDNVTILLADQKTLISGTLQAASLVSVNDYIVVAFPAVTSFWQSPARRARIAHPATDGAFEISGLPPGEYCLSIIRSLEADQPLTSLLFDRLAPQAKRVVLTAGEHLQGLQLDAKH